MNQQQKDRLTFYVSAFEGGSLVGRGLINDRTFDEQRHKATKAALETGQDVSECVQWLEDAIQSGLLRFVAPQVQVIVRDLDEVDEVGKTLAQESYLSFLIHHFNGVDNLLHSKAEFESAMDSASSYPSDDPVLQKQMSPWFEASDLAWEFAFQRIGRSPRRDHPYFEIELVEAPSNEARVERQIA